MQKLAYNHKAVLNKLNFILTPKRFLLSTLTYPLYFLNFETIQPVILQFMGTKFDPIEKYLISENTIKQKNKAAFCNATFIFGPTLNAASERHAVIRRQSPLK